MILLQRVLLILIIIIYTILKIRGLICSKITVIVNDEKKKHSSKINIKAIKVGEGNSSDELKKAKIASHGIIAKDKKGEILTTVEGHNYGKEKIKEVISLILNKKK